MNDFLLLRVEVKQERVIQEAEESTGHGGEKSVLDK